MDKVWEHNYNRLSHKHSGTQDEVADVLRKKREVMNSDMSILIKLAEYYYETNKVKDYSKYIKNPDCIIEDDEKVSQLEHLYTLIKYEGRDTAIQIGTGRFAPEIFTRKDIPAYKWFSHSPLPLFVVAARAEQDHRENNPKKFFNEQAILYAPKWGQIEERISYKQKEHNINYGESNGIMDYSDAILALQNGQIHKTFSSPKSLEKFIAKIKELKRYSPEKLLRRSNIKKEFLSKNKWETEVYSEEEFYNIVHDCLRNISGKDQEKIYTLIQSFDLHKKGFTHTHIF